MLNSIIKSIFPTWDDQNLISIQDRMLFFFSSPTTNFTESAVFQALGVKCYVRSLDALQLKQTLLARLRINYLHDIPFKTFESSSAIEEQLNNFSALSLALPDNFSLSDLSFLIFMTASASAL